MAKQKQKAAAKAGKPPARPPKQPNGQHHASPHPVGRPSKFTPMVRAKLLQYAVVAISEENLAQAVGIGYSTLRDWIVRGEQTQKLIDAGETVLDEDRAYAEFSEQYKSTRAEAELLALTTIRAHESWQSKAWWLQRRNAHVYGLPKTDKSGGQAAPGTDPAKPISTDDRLTRLQKLIGRIQPGGKAAHA